jgi:hypothetical protein
MRIALLSYLLCRSTATAEAVLGLVPAPLMSFEAQKKDREC